MYEINKEKFGTFLSQLRRERGMTQKDLAEKLYVSDKAVSKWERALSLPDIALLRPLAEMLEVTVTELLIGERVAPDRPLTVAARLVPIFSDLSVMLWLPPLFGLLFGVYFTFFSAEKLPVFYDQYRLNFVSDGIFQMNMPGMRFNNNNWPHILRAMRAWSCVVLAGWVPVYVALWLALDWLGAPWVVVHIVTLLAGLAATLEGMFVPIYVVGRKYE